MRHRLLYDIDSYDIFIHSKKIQHGLAYISDGDIVTVDGRYSVERYRCMFDSKKYENYNIFRELSGEIYILPPNAIIPRVMTETLFSEVIDENYIHIEYDGMTHITIENSDYVYTENMPYYADIDVKYDDGIFLFLYNICDIMGVIIVKKDIDYIECLNIRASSIVIGESSIQCTSYLFDSLGRIRYEEYVYVDGVYTLSKCEFDYTYRVHYDESVACMLIEDAVIARDYSYISEFMKGDVAPSDIALYFDSILGDSRDILKIEPISNTMHFVTRRGGCNTIVDVEVYFDKDGKIVNFDGGDNE